MVVLTIVTQKNGETVFFDEPFPKVHFMRLISCSLYNSWHNLTRAGQMSFKTSGKVLASIPAGHYTFESTTKELKTSIESFIKAGGFKIEIEIETNEPNSLLNISRLTSVIPSEIKVTHDLARLIGTSTTLGQLEYIKKLNSPSSYFVHCDLIDKNQNFFNNKKSDLLAKFDVKGKPYEKVTYNASPQQPLRDCSIDSHVNSIALGVRDQDGVLFDFKGLPLEFVSEIK